MPEAKLDCRGLACPSPVLKTKDIIDRGAVDRLTVLVDNDAARENVSRFLARSGFAVFQEMTGDGYAVTGVRQDTPGAIPPPPVASPTATEPRILVLLATDRLGRGDDDLGRKLAVNFLATLKEMGRDLWRLVLVNAGVKLTVAGSPALGSLQQLAQAGVSILVCGTCLDHFGLLNAKQVGDTTNMLDIVTSLQLADKVISLT